MDEQSNEFKTEKRNAVLERIKQIDKYIHIDPEEILASLEQLCELAIKLSIENNSHEEPQSI